MLSDGEIKIVKFTTNRSNRIGILEWAYWSLGLSSSQTRYSYAFSRKTNVASKDLQAVR